MTTFNDLKQYREPLNKASTELGQGDTVSCDRKAACNMLLSDDTLGDEYRERTTEPASI